MSDRPRALGTRAGHRVRPREIVRQILVGSGPGEREHVWPCREAGREVLLIRERQEEVESNRALGLLSNRRDLLAKQFIGQASVDDSACGAAGDGSGI